MKLLFCIDFMLKKPCLKFPKSANFWIENDPLPPFGAFLKIHPIWSFRIWPSFPYEKLLVMLVNMHITKLQKWDSTDAIRM